MPAKVKQYMIWLAVIFAVFATVKNPEQSAEVVRTIWDLLYMIVGGFLEFFSALTSFYMSANSITRFVPVIFCFRASLAHSSANSFNSVPIWPRVQIKLAREF